MIFCGRVDNEIKDRISLRRKGYEGLGGMSRVDYIEMRELVREKKLAIWMTLLRK